MAPNGWLICSNLATEIGTSPATIKKNAELFRETNPEWFHRYKTVNGHSLEHYAPDLVEELKSNFNKYEEVPEGWMNGLQLEKEFGISQGSLGRSKIISQNRELHPEWFKRFKPKNTVRDFEYFSPEIVRLFEERKKEFDLVPDGWLANNTLSRILSIGERTIKEAVLPYRMTDPEWFKKYRSIKGIVYEYYSPELVDKLEKQFNVPVPDGYKSSLDLTKELDLNYSVINKYVDQFREPNPEYFKRFRAGGRFREYYGPELVENVKNHFLSLEIIPDGWLNNNQLAEKLNVNYLTAERITNKYRDSNPEWFKGYKVNKGSLIEYYSPDLVSKIMESRQDIEPYPPEGWFTKFDLSKKLKRTHFVINKQVEIFRKEYPKLLKTCIGNSGRPLEYISPELVQKIEEKLSAKSLREISKIKDQEVLDFFDKFDSSKEGEEFKRLISLFGSSQIVDILYVAHPDFKAVPVERLRSLIAEYLGNFTLTGVPFSLDNLEGNLGYLKTESLKDGLIEVVKNHCLTNFLIQKKENPDYSEKRIFDDYFFELEQKTKGFDSQELKEVIEKVSEYYFSILEVPKNDNLVESVGSGRNFPDIYQRINIQEVGDKKRLLIADEMGVGKSASAILSKELLGAECALVVIPSNVVDTWKSYLSDRIGENGKQIGYFKQGKAPGVLVVENLESIKNLQGEKYDYILLSQERLSEKYAEVLVDIDYDMLIVDEVHRFKNLSQAKRPEHLLKLSEKVHGENNYLVLLSGTPVPNKVEDVALLLRLLHPDRFDQVDPKTLVSSILEGNLSDIRSLLVLHMQRKDLKDHIEMPKLTESTIPVFLNQMEQDIYQVLLEEDELSPTQKISILRRFLLNHHGLEATPDIPSSKVNRLERELLQSFSEKDKILLFVNDYVDGVIIGEQSIIEQMKLPASIEIRVIHGGISQEERQIIQKEFNSNSNNKILLVVSGQTAGVGVDYTGGEQIYFYNEPWTKADADQQKARVYRPGLKRDLKSDTLLTMNSLEEGIHRYIEIKHRAIEKLLDGIPITEFEKELLEKNEKSKEDNLEVNPELANYYFSSFDKMNKIFSAVKEMGEKNFMQFIERYGAEYADCYTELGSRSYQANASRICASVIDKVIGDSEQKPNEVSILDIASGPEMLRRHSKDNTQKSITSVDVNINHFIAKGTQNALIGGFTDLPVDNESFDYANLSLALHYSKFLPSRGEYERAKVLEEINRILKVGGKAVINMIYTLDFKDIDKFAEITDLLGLRVVKEYSGEVKVSNNYRSRVIVLEKIKNLDRSARDIVSNLSRDTLDGLKLYRTENDLKDSRKIIDSFELNGEVYNIEFNQHDKKMVLEERGIMKEGEDLKLKYGSISSIPKEEIISKGFTRILINKKYLLFKKMKEGGVVLVRG